MNSVEALEFLLKHKTFSTVLDVGSGSGEHARRFREHNKVVTCVDIGNSPYFGKSKDSTVVLKNFNQFQTDQKFDLVWCSHILEHQQNVGMFLEKCYDLLTDKGILCITVPPMKSAIVGGHLTVWNMGLLFYNLVMAGIDCSTAHGKQYGYNISVIIERTKKIPLSGLNLAFDLGDLPKLQPYFPWKIKQNDNGNILEINWSE